MAGSALRGVVPAGDTSPAVPQCFVEGPLSRGDPIRGFALQYSEFIVLDTWILGFFELVWWQWALTETRGSWVRGPLLPT